MTEDRILRDHSEEKCKKLLSLFITNKQSAIVMKQALWQVFGIVVWQSGYRQACKLLDEALSFIF